MEEKVYQAKTREHTERLRSEMFAIAQVQAESAIKEAEGKMEANKREADAHLYKIQKQAEGILVFGCAPACSLYIHR